MGKVLKDADSIVEKELATKVYNYAKKYWFDACIYNAKIKELSESSKYSEKYLRSLKHVYLDLYASEEELNDYRVANKIIREKDPKFIEFGNALFELPIEDRNNYVLSSGLSLYCVKNMLSKYKKRNCKYSCMVDDFLSQYVVFNAKYCEFEHEKHMKEDYRECLSIFDQITCLGFYSISHYNDYLFKPGYEYKKNLNHLNSIRKKIKRYDKIYGKDNWGIIKNRFESNRKKSFFILKDRIDYFNSKLRECKNDNSFNIIDYYLILGISFKDYRDICSGLISQYDMYNFDIFSKKYEKMIYDTSFFERVDINISEKEKAMLYDFLNKNSIPECYYNFVVDKYINGQLDNYIKGDLDIKVKSLKKEF